jgi:hypothetical protein
VTYFILFIVSAFICWPMQYLMVKRYGTSSWVRLIRKAPKEASKRKEFIAWIFIVNLIAFAGILFLGLSLVSFWEALKTIGP